MSKSQISDHQYDEFIASILDRLMEMPVEYREGYLDGAYSLFCYIEDGAVL